jgi:NAD(P)-dependent dehydrogenase (short-subunit alcohol dehydrogenase family)
MPVLLVVGYGPGNSHALARRFGAEGWAIALVGRTRERLADGARRLTDEGIAAHAFPGDASDPASIRSTIDRVREQLGAITAVAFTAYRPVVLADVLTAAPETIEEVFDIGVSGLLAVVQATVDDLRAAEGASVLVLNGALGIHDAAIDGFAITIGGDGVALESAAKSKLVGLLAERLRPAGVYVGELVINGSIKGSPYASATAIDPADVAQRLWDMAAVRTEVRTHIAEI